MFNRTKDGESDKVIFGAFVCPTNVGNEVIGNFVGFEVGMLEGLLDVG
jgi:hypothetical protein